MRHHTNQSARYLLHRGGRWSILQPMSSHDFIEALVSTGVARERALNILAQTEYDDRPSAVEWFREQQCPEPYDGFTGREHTLGRHLH